MSSHQVATSEADSDSAHESTNHSNQRAHRCTICDDQFVDRDQALAHVPKAHFEISANHAAHYVKAEAELSAAASSDVARRRTSRPPADLIGHWHALLDPIATTPLAFYSLVEAAFASREVPDACTARIDYREAGVGSARREYLRIARGRHVCDVCAAPFGQGFFVSWWLGEPRPGPVGVTLLALLYVGFLGWLFVTKIGIVIGILATLAALMLTFVIVGAAMSQGETLWEPHALALPYVGPMWERFFRPTTYYRNDTALMFKEQIRRSVLEVVDGLTKTHGVRALSDDERKPILRDFYRR